MELIFLIAIAYRISRLLVRDTIFNELRFKIGGIHPEVDYLFSCYWCMGVYVGLLTTIFGALTVGIPTVLTFVGTWAILATSTGLIGTLTDKAERF